MKIHLFQDTPLDHNNYNHPGKENTFGHRFGHYNVPILQFLRGKNYQVFRYNPILIKRFSKIHTLRKTKTDKADALVIAKK
ncbi:IS110 family transposase [Virgibacillus proomii]|uniref:IS110 family transposase n=1 Tax=Virgibacillus proomii TaxID=84407 RepID=UPI001C111074|nr:IS110 family transposase [Virgibacillus proomii]